MHNFASSLRKTFKIWANEMPNHGNQLLKYQESDLKPLGHVDLKMKLLEPDYHLKPSRNSVLIANFSAKGTLNFWKISNIVTHTMTIIVAMLVII